MKLVLRQYLYITLIFSRCKFRYSKGGKKTKKQNSANSVNPQSKPQCCLFSNTFPLAMLTSTHKQQGCIPENAVCPQPQLKSIGAEHLAEKCP